MDLIRHHGKTIATDFHLSLGWKGGYIAVGRLDAGFNTRPSDWRLNWSWGGWGGLSRLLLGPLDFMWNDK